MAAAASTPLGNNSQVSTGRVCDFCHLGIRNTQWFACSKCFRIDCCLDCFKNQANLPTMALKLEGDAPNLECAVLSESVLEKLPQPVSGSSNQSVMVDAHALHLYAYDVMMENHHYSQLTKNIREAEYDAIKDTKEEIQFNRRTLTILTWKLGELETDTRLLNLVEDDRELIFALLGKMFSRPTRTRILTLDGGGIRGYFTIRVLEEAFKLVAKNFGGELQKVDSTLLPATMFDANDNLTRPAYFAAQKYFMQKFDMIVGTSTGALIGFCLAVDIPLYQIRELYANAREKLFKDNSNFLVKRFVSEFPFWGPKYDSGAIETTLLQILHQWYYNKAQPQQLTKEEVSQAKKIRLSDIIPRIGAGPTLSGEQRQLVINAFDMGHNKMINFNTGYAPHHHYGVFDIVRGAMAGELYFSPHKPSLTTYSNDSKSKEDDYLTKALYVDAGIYANDPTLIALYIARLNPKHLPSSLYVALGIGAGVHDSTFPDGIGEGGLWSWIGGKWSPKVDAGLLPNACMEATRSFTETVASDLGRAHTLRRFKYNVQLPNAAVIDDFKFLETVDKGWEKIQKDTDMKALRVFIMKYVTFKAPSTEEEEKKSASVVSPLPAGNQLIGSSVVTSQPDTKEQLKLNKDQFVKGQVVTTVDPKHEKEYAKEKSNQFSPNRIQ